MSKLKSQTDIPIIDPGKLKEFENPTSTEWKHVADEIRGALGSVGFLYLINHGVPQDTLYFLGISQVFKSSHDFFNLPSNIKLKYRKITQNDGKIFNLDSNFGYLPPGEVNDKVMVR
ncbi:unnamed protein product [Orchesella dallaii]|uniref:Non-haem dioxygenase N-terminal domain-containing protein n=1 Tax=Orchesella dallaii TaxID=48710 RepID=A0ABP1QLT8_9HEXA